MNSLSNAVLRLLCESAAVFSGSCPVNSINSIHTTTENLSLCCTGSCDLSVPGEQFEFAARKQDKKILCSLLLPMAVLGLG